MNERRNISRRAFIGTGAVVGSVLLTGSVLSSMVGRYVTRVRKYGSDTSGLFSGGKGNPVFKYYPKLKEGIPWNPIGTFPTPVEELGSAIGLRKDQLFVKRDDLSSSLHGGNKVRKLEHLLAEASALERDTLITIGGIGSNHALATAIHGASRGFKVELCLFREAISSHVRENLEGMLAAGAKICYCENMYGAYKKARMRFRELKKNGAAPYFIVSGGSCGISNIGHISAALELKDQVKKGLMPEPDAIFVPVGTSGTVSGLLAGVKLAGLSSKVCGVDVYGSFPANRYMIRKFANNALDCMQKIDPSVPSIQVSDADFNLLHNYLGEGYGIATRECMEAVSKVSSRLCLETTYTGKTMAAALDFCRGRGKEETVLFWNTYNSAPFPGTENADGLPDELKELLQADQSVTF